MWRPASTKKIQDTGSNYREHIWGMSGKEEAVTLSSVMPQNVKQKWCSYSDIFPVHKAQYIKEKKNGIPLFFFKFSWFFLATELAQPSADIYLYLTVSRKCFSCDIKHKERYRFYYACRLYHMKPWGSQHFYYLTVMPWVAIPLITKFVHAVKL